MNYIAYHEDSNLVIGEALSTKSSPVSANIFDDGTVDLIIPDDKINEAIDSLTELIDVLKANR